ncbi:DUF4743 domain-containing protein [Alphaproteobacteria bacterium]|jgi:hypothetical protein|nr:DUF4743 domain-containing protein [Alphaproteobacteria bacterium]
MALIDRIRAVQQRSPASFTSFTIDGEIVGFLPMDLAKQLCDVFPASILLEDGELTFQSSVADFDTRSTVLADVSDFFLRDGLMPKPRNEPYPIKNHWNQSPFANLERNASIPLGLITYGVNLHAWTLDQTGHQLLWVGKRSLDKQTEPGKLDHIAAGGQPAMLGLHENMIKEAEEEASVPAQLARMCRPVGSISGHYHGEFCRRFIHYNFDLELPGDFQPQPLDGEVESFTLMSPQKVIEFLRSGYHFDLESAVAIIDWLIRHGHIHAENEPDFDQVESGLKADLFTL